MTLRFVLTLILLTLPTAAAEKQPFNRLYVFGDSYSDIGEGYLDGDGPTAVAYLAQHLGLTLAPSNKLTSPKDSLDFAVSGAGTGRSPGRKVEDALLGYGMQNQVDDFCSLVLAQKLSFTPKKALFYIAGGLNDGKLPTETTVANLKNEIKQLYGFGGRHFALALLPIAIANFSAEGERLNPALTLIPEQLKQELPQAKITLSRWGPFFDEVMRNAPRYGIRNTTDACAGRAIFHQDAKPCDSPGDHYYYHFEHPSTAVHKVVGEKLYEELVKARPQSGRGHSSSKRH